MVFDPFSVQVALHLSKVTCSFTRVIGEVFQNVDGFSKNPLNMLLKIWNNSLAIWSIAWWKRWVVVGRPQVNFCIRVHKIQATPLYQPLSVPVYILYLSYILHCAYFGICICPVIAPCLEGVWMFEGCPVSKELQAVVHRSLEIVEMTWRDLSVLCYHLAYMDWKC